VDVVLSAAGRVRLDPSGEVLRPQATVDKLFVEVGALLSEQRRLRDQRQDVLAAQGDVAELRARAAIGIGRKERHTEIHAQRKKSSENVPPSIWPGGDW